MRGNLHKQVSRSSSGCRREPSCLQRAGDDATNNANADLMASATDGGSHNTDGDEEVAANDETGIVRSW